MFSVGEYVVWMIIHFSLVMLTNGSPKEPEVAI
jgi:hypothetical protein